MATLTSGGTAASLLPPGITVFERGWLSANNILLHGKAPALVDSGYGTHATQTVALVEAALAGQPLATLVNTHLHSDHCGGNAALQNRYPALSTWIPPGQAALVQNWDPVGLSYTPTGQVCPPFRMDGVLQPGSTVNLGDLVWQVHAAPGHDPHSILLFQADHRVLLSADALWERGFGVVFPELEGEPGFTEVAQTLDLIEQLAPRVVIPGHGAPFTDVGKALDYARQRLAAFSQDTRWHASHAAKVLIKFKLLELQRVRTTDMQTWMIHTPLLMLMHSRYFAELNMADWVQQLLAALVRSGAVTMDEQFVVNA